MLEEVVPFEQTAERLFNLSSKSFASGFNEWQGLLIDKNTPIAKKDDDASMDFSVLSFKGQQI